MPDPHGSRPGHAGPGASRRLARIRLVSLVLGLVVLLGAIGVSTSSARKEPRTDKVSAANRALAPAVAANRREHKRLMRKRRTARERRARHKSRSAYKKLNGRRSIKLARAKFELMAEPLWQPPQLPDAARVDEYIGDRAMVVDVPGDGKALVESLLPLVAADEQGRMDPVDLTVDSSGDAFEPRNALATSRLPKNLRSAATLEGGISVEVVGDDVAGRLVDGKVYYTDVAQDTDAVLAPLPTGIEYFAQLRSIDSPEDYELELGLPGEAKLKRDKTGGISIVDGNATLGRISEPSTADADGVAVPTSYKLVGNRLAIHVDHRGRDVKRPLLLDPVIETFRWHCPPVNGQDQSGYGCGSSGADTDRWDYDEYPEGDARLYEGFNDHNGYGLDLYLDAAPSNPGYPAWAQNSWNWKPPGAAYIYRAEFGLFRYTGGTNIYVAQGIAQPNREWEDGPRGAHWFGPGLTPGPSPFITWNGEVQNWSWRTHCVRSACDANDATIPGPNEYRVVLFTGGGGVPVHGWAHLGAAYMYLHDRDAPTWTDKGSISTSWAHNHTGTLNLGASDPSLGMKTLEVVWPPGVGGSATRTDTCPGGNWRERAEPAWGRCDSPFSAGFPYDTAGWPEGEQVMRIRAADVVGNYTNPDNETKTVRIDRTRPEYNADSGELREGGPNWITDPSPSLTVDIRDPTTNASQVSGVKFSKIDFDPGSGPSDTKQNDKADGSAGPCDAQSGCRSTLNQPHTLTWDDPPDGTRSIRVSTEDAAGNPNTSRTWNVTFERAGPSIDSLSGPLSVNHKWVRPGNTYSVTVDTSDTASGVKEIRLKVNGNQVDSASGEPRPGTSACDGAGCHRDPAPKTLSWTVPASYDDPPATLEVVAIDAAGNASDASRTIRVDRNPPFPEPDFGGSLWEARGKAVRGTSFELFMRGSDGDDELQSSGVQQMFLDIHPPGGGPVERKSSPVQSCGYSSCPQEYTFPFSTTSADTGRTPRRFVPSVKDQVGFEEPSEPFDVLFDNAAPTLDDPPGKPDPERWYKGDQSFSTALTSRDTGSGVKLFRLFTPRAGGEDVQEEVDPSCSDALTSLCPTDPPSKSFDYSTSGMPDSASNTVRAVSADAVTNESVARAWTLKVDKTPPNPPGATGEIASDGDWIGPEDTTLHATATDQLSGVQSIEFQVDGVRQGEPDEATCGSVCPPSHSADFEWDHTEAAPGEHTLRLVARDFAGNESERVWTVRVDDTVPGTTLTEDLAELNGEIVSEPRELRVEAFDGESEAAESGVASVLIRAGGQTFTTDSTCSGDSCQLGTTWTLDPASFAEGNLPIEVIARDKAGNATRESLEVFIRHFDAPNPQQIDLNSATAVRFVGAAAGDAAGTSVATLGDVDGDGLTDFAIGAPNFDGPAGPDAGAVFVVWGDAGATTVDLADVHNQNDGSPGPLGYRIDGATLEDHAGTSVSAAGDVNGDGRADLVLGAPKVLPALPGLSINPYAAVVLGRTRAESGDVRLSELGNRGFLVNGPVISASNALAGYPPAPFGSTVSGAAAGDQHVPGDVNGDGRDDVVIGSSTEGRAGLDAGSAYVVFGRTETTAVDTSAEGAWGYRIDGASGERLGYAVALAGDVDNDGHADVVVGAPGHAVVGRNQPGAAYVVHGKTDTQTVDMTTGTGGRRVQVVGRDSDRLGYSVSGVGDVDADDRDDFAVSGHNAYAIYGDEQAPAELDMQTAQLPQLGWRMAAPGAGVEFDTGVVSGVGDIDGDGLPDVSIGYPDAADQRTNNGRSYTVMSRPVRFAEVNLGALPADHGSELIGAEDNDRSGASAASVENTGNGEAGQASGSPGASRSDTGAAQAGGARVTRRAAFTSEVPSVGYKDSEHFPRRCYGRASTPFSWPRSKTPICRVTAYTRSNTRRYYDGPPPKTRRKRLDGDPMTGGHARRDIRGGAFIAAGKHALRDSLGNVFAYIEQGTPDATTNRGSSQRWTVYRANAAGGVGDEVGRTRGAGPLKARWSLQMQGRACMRTNALEEQNTMVVLGGVLASSRGDDVGNPGHTPGGEVVDLGIRGFIDRDALPATSFQTDRERQINRLRSIDVLSERAYAGCGKVGNYPDEQQQAVRTEGFGRQNFQRAERVQGTGSLGRCRPRDADDPTFTYINQCGGTYLNYERPVSGGFDVLLPTSSSPSVDGGGIVTAIVRDGTDFRELDRMGYVDETVPCEREFVARWVFGDYNPNRAAGEHRIYGWMPLREPTGRRRAYGSSGCTQQDYENFRTPPPQP